MHFVPRDVRLFDFDLRHDFPDGVGSAVLEEKPSREEEEEEVHSCYYGLSPA